MPDLSLQVIKSKVFTTQDPITYLPLSPYVIYEWLLIKPQADFHSDQILAASTVRGRFSDMCSTALAK